MKNLKNIKLIHGIISAKQVTAFLLLYYLIIVLSNSSFASKNMVKIIA